ncbi:MAG: Do family serine endopeptidase [bacterium]|nr:Do family serine endopeptidase [bacterium]
MKKGLLVALLVMPALLCSEPPKVEIKGSLPITSEGKSPFVRIAKELMPAVVSISAEKIVNVRDPFSEFFGGTPDDFFRQFMPELRTPQRRQKLSGLGSGFIVSEDGYILTNNHVISGASSLTIKMMDEKEYKAKVIGSDPVTDIALLKIDVTGLPYAKLGNSDEIEVGDWVMAIGNPFQLFGTVTVGVVSAKDRRDIDIGGLEDGPKIQDFIQTDAAINPGNSGGPLVNLKGEVIGINAAIKTGGMTAGNIGIGFAVPINMAQKVKSDLVQYKEVKRGWLGVAYEGIGTNRAQAYGVKDTTEILVISVLTGSPAEKAGIKEEDILVEWDGKKIDYKNFASIVLQTPLNKKIAVKIFRDKAFQTVFVTVGEMPSEMKGTVEPQIVEKWLDMDVVSVKSQEAERLNIKASSGVVVASIDEGSIAYEAGIRTGDIITKIGNREIKNLQDYESAHSTYGKSKAPIVVKLKRGAGKAIVAFTPNPK